MNWNRRSRVDDFSESDITPELERSGKLNAQTSKIRRWTRKRMPSDDFISISPSEWKTVFERYEEHRLEWKVEKFLHFFETARPSMMIRGEFEVF